MLILISGASKGIGFEMVKLFIKDPKNLVVAVSRNTDTLTQLVKQHNTHSLLPVKADITKPLHLKKIHNAIKSLDLPLDILINNAGLIVNKPFEKIRYKDLTAVYSTNVFAPFALMQMIFPLMNKDRRSHIVNISSMGGVQGSSKFAGLSAYSSSKAALCNLSECLAEEFKTRNVAVNCLAIGAVQTEMLRKAFPDHKAPLKAHQMAEFICNFALNGHQYFNGKVIPVSLSTP
jgi:3-oxoacyl-[acyl-carrier protein] reductase